MCVKHASSAILCGKVDTCTIVLIVADYKEEKGTTGHSFHQLTDQCAMLEKKS